MSEIRISATGEPGPTGDPGERGPQGRRGRRGFSPTGRLILWAGLLSLIINFATVGGLAWYVQWDDGRDAKDATERRENICSVAEGGDHNIIDILANSTYDPTDPPEKQAAFEKAVKAAHQDVADQYVDCATENP